MREANGLGEGDNLRERLVFHKARPAPFAFHRPEPNSQSYSRGSGGTSSSAAAAPPALLLILQHTMNCFSRVDADQKHEANLARKTTTGEKRRARGGEGPGRPTRRPRRRRRRLFLMVNSRKRAELQAAARHASTCSLAGAPLGGPICSARTSGGIRRNAGAGIRRLAAPCVKAKLVVAFGDAGKSGYTKPQRWAGMRCGLLAVPPFAACNWNSIYGNKKITTL